MKFRLIDLFWVISLVAVCLSWRFDRDALRAKYERIKPLVRKLDITTLADYIKENGGPDNLHMLHVSFSAYYGSRAEMRFKQGETLPVIKKLEMHNEEIYGQSKEKTYTWSRSNWSGD